MRRPLAFRRVPYLLLTQSPRHWLQELASPSRISPPDLGARCCELGQAFEVLFLHFELSLSSAFTDDDDQELFVARRPAQLLDRLKRERRDEPDEGGVTECLRHGVRERLLGEGLHDQRFCRVTQDHVFG